MYNDTREEYKKTAEDSFSTSSKHLHKIRGRGIFYVFYCRCALICALSLIFGLPSTLSSDARFNEGAYYEFGQEDEHSAEEEGTEPTDALPQPYIQNQMKQRQEYKEPAERRNYFENKVPRNKIPRNVIPKSQTPRNVIEKSPMPRTSIEKSSIEKNAIPRQRIERNQIEKKPLPKKPIPRNPIPRN